ncbi:MAG: bifunctional riboflavin kinase/FAD synthetase [Anaerolineae bacterium]|nr:bifunctional riboflavin kinase/FAD synthetase [Anaerolineae bacterium]
MDVLDDLAKASLPQETILTIGAFDGVHRGHQALIKSVVERARATDRLAAVITFHPHPVVALAPQRAPRYLTTPGEKMALLEGLGVDLTVLLPFDRQVAAMSARDFMAMVSRHVRVRELWVGPDFGLGRNREGNVERLRELGRDLGYDLHVVEPVGAAGSSQAFSSSRIRELLAQGRVGEAALQLGRYPSLSGEVVTGARRGHTLGFPTANLQVRPERAVPADGVYAVFALLGSERYLAVANVGVRPSFDNGHRTVETHILDFDQDIYGCDLVVEFVARLRDERRFEHIEDLIAQIEQDSEAARRILDRSSLSLPLGDEGWGEVEGPGQRQGSEPSACPYRYQEVEHTADRALCVWGRELPDLFAGAARGMASLMADLDGLAATEWREVRLEAWDRESLLVNWLNELLFLTETERLLFVDFRIESLIDTALVARVRGARAPVTKAVVKAATYHDLRLVRNDAGWSAVITFDV